MQTTQLTETTKITKKVIVSLNWKKYINPSHKYIKSFINQFGPSLYTDIIESITSAHTSNQKYCLLFTFSGDEYGCIVHETEYTQVLTQILNWYISKEDYRKCGQIKNLIQTIKKEKVISKKVINN